MKSAVPLVSGSDHSGTQGGTEILFPREPYLFLGEAVPELGEPPILPCLLGESCPSVPKGKGGAGQVQRCYSRGVAALSWGHCI